MTTYLSATFDADTVNSVPSGWTASGDVGKWTTQASPPAGMVGRALRSAQDTSSSAILESPSFTRQTSGVIYLRWQQWVGSNNGSGYRWGHFRIRDTSTFVTYLAVISGNLSILKADGSAYDTIAAVTGSLLYDLEVKLDLTAKKVLWVKANGTKYDNSGSGWATNASAGGVDRIQLDSFSTNAAAGEYVWFDNIDISDSAAQLRYAPDNWGWSDAPVYDNTPVVTASGTLDGVTLGCDKYAAVTLGVKEIVGADSLVIERSGDGGSTWATITSSCTITSLGGGHWSVLDPRPQSGSQSVSYGGTARYRVTAKKGGVSSTVSASVSVATNVDEDAWIVARSAALSSYMNGTYVAMTAGSGIYPAYWTMAMAYAYYYSVQRGSPVSQYLTDCMNQHNYIASGSVTNGSNYVVLSFDSAHIYTDYHWRTVLHEMVAARLLRLAGATSQADTIVAQCDTWATAYTDNFASWQTSITLTGYDVSNASGTGNQTARQNSHAYALGDVMTYGGHAYRCTVAGTSAGSAPSFNTSAGATTTDGTVTWTEVTASGNALNTSSLAPVSAGTFDPNQQTEVCAALAMLMDEPSSVYHSAGSRRTAATNAITDIVNLMMALQTSSGAFTVNTSYSGTAGIGQYDTLYMGFCLQTMAITYRLRGAVHANLQNFINQGRLYLRNNYDTEPYTHARYDSSTDIGFSEMFYRDALAKATGNTEPSRPVLFSAAYSYRSNGKISVYKQAGAGSGDVYADQLQAYAFDGLAIGQAGLSYTITGSSDTWAWSDAPVAPLTRTRPAGDTWGWSDSTTGAISRGRSASDTWAWSDTPARQESTSRTSADTWAWSDSASQVLGHSSSTGTRTAADSWAWTDTAAGPRVTPATYPRTAADIWLWQDQVSRPVTPSPPEDPGYRLTFDIGPYL